MKKRLFFAVFISSILLLFLGKNEVFATICDLPMDWCRESIGSPQNTCCTTGGCSSECGTLNQWDWCYANKCCATLSEECDIGSASFSCYYNFYYSYKYESCGATDTCAAAEPRLKAGLCGATGCEKGGYYKLCCEVDAYGNFTGNLGGNCLGGNYSGVCPPGSAPYIGSSCPSGVVSPTPTPTPPPGCGGTCCPSDQCIGPLGEPGDTACTNSDPSTPLCCNNCKTDDGGESDPMGRIKVWFYNDINKNGEWDPSIDTVLPESVINNLTTVINGYNGRTHTGLYSVGCPNPRWHQMTADASKLKLDQGTYGCQDYYPACCPWGNSFTIGHVCNVNDVYLYLCQDQTRNGFLSGTEPIQSLDDYFAIGPKGSYVYYSSTYNISFLPPAGWEITKTKWNVGSDIYETNGGYFQTAIEAMNTSGNQFALRTKLVKVGVSKINNPPRVFSFSIDSPDNDGEPNTEAICDTGSGTVLSFTTQFMDSDEPYNNPVNNGSFEGGDNYWIENAIDWEIDSVGVFGSHSFKLKKQSSGDPYLVTDWIDYGENLAGKSFTLSFSLKAESGTTIDRIALQSYPTDGNWSNSSYQEINSGTPINVDANWKRYVYTLTFPSDLSETKFRVVLRPPGDGSFAWYDGVLVQEVSTEGTFPFPKGIFSDIRAFQLNIENAIPGGYDNDKWPLRLMFNQSWWTGNKDSFYFTTAAGDKEWRAVEFDEASQRYYLGSDVSLLGHATVLGKDENGKLHTYFTVTNGVINAHWEVRFENGFPLSPDGVYHTTLYVKDWANQEDEYEESAGNILEVDGNTKDIFDDKYDFHRMGTLAVESCVGTITGYVYQDETAGCNGTSDPGDKNNWRVTCNGTRARQDSSSQFTCVDEEGNDQLPYGNYTIIFTPSRDNTSVCALSDCCDNSLTITIDSDNPNGEVTFFQVVNAGAWFQTQGGDVYGQNGIASSIPDACKGDFSCQAYFSLALEDYGGMVSSPALTNRDFSPGGQATEGEGDEWSLDADFTAIKNAYSYSYFENLLDTACNEGSGDNQSDNESVSCEFNVSSIDAMPDSGYSVYVYNVDSDLAALSITGSDWNVGDRQMIVLVKFTNSNPSLSTLTVNPQIAVGTNGFFAIITNGSIKFTQETTDPSSTTPQVEGVYIADGTISTDSKNEKFVGEGIFFAKEGFYLERDLGSGNNLTHPSELFIFAPQYLFTAPKIFRVPRQYWQEVAP